MTGVVTDCFWPSIRHTGTPKGKLHAARPDKVTAWCGQKRRGTALLRLEFNPTHPDACQHCVRALAKESGAK